MGESVDDIDGFGGGFDVDGLKKKYRRQDAASKPRNALAAIEREILEEVASQSGRYGDRLNALLGEMATLRQSIEPNCAKVGGVTPTGGLRSTPALRSITGCAPRLSKCSIT